MCAKQKVCLEQVFFGRGGDTGLIWLLRPQSNYSPTFAIGWAALVRAIWKTRRPRSREEEKKSKKVKEYAKRPSAFSYGRFVKQGRGVWLWV